MKGVMVSKAASRIAVKDVPKILERCEDMLGSDAYIPKRFFGRDMTDVDPRFTGVLGLIERTSLSLAQRVGVYWVEDALAAIAVDAAQSVGSWSEGVVSGFLTEWEESAVGVVVYERGTGIYVVDREEPSLFVREVIGYVKKPSLSPGGDLVLLNVRKPAKGFSFGVPRSLSLGEVGSFGQCEEYVLDDLVGIGDMGSEVVERVKNLVRATFLLMDDSSLVRSGVENVGEVVRRRHGKRRVVRSGYPVRSVRVCSELMSSSSCSVSVDEGKGSGGKKWTLGYRVITRGHWRQVAYGRGHQFRRVQWIMPYVRGPEGAVVVNRPVVKVWRRG